jgi:hypothetical protein
MSNQRNERSSKKKLQLKPQTQFQHYKSMYRSNM